MRGTYGEIVGYLFIALVFFIIGAVYGHWIETQALMNNCLTIESVRLDGRAFVCFEVYK